MMTTPNISVSSSGEPKTGKTHFALTFPEPIAVFSFDLRGAELLLPKFKGKEIEIFKFTPKLSMSPNADKDDFVMWEELRDTYQAVVEDGRWQTIVLDPATIAWEIIRHAWEVERNKGKLMSRDYGAPNSRMTWMLCSPIVAGKNIVTTQYLRDVYVDDKATGESTLDGFKRTNGITDIALVNTVSSRAATPQEKKDLGISRVTQMSTEIAACRFDRTLVGEKITDCGYDDLIALLGF